MLPDKEKAFVYWLYRRENARELKGLGRGEGLSLHVIVRILICKSFLYNDLQSYLMGLDINTTQTHQKNGGHFG